MDRKWLFFTAVVSLVLLVASASQSVSGAGLGANSLTAYYNLLGYEGIPTLGSPPPVVDYVSTWCRYVNIPDTEWGDYWLNYPLHLPNGANITEVALRVADFDEVGGNFKALLFRRAWESRQAGESLAIAQSFDDGATDKTILMSVFDGLPVNVDNQTYQYWVSVTSEAHASPGQLCVYSLQVQYTIDGAFLPLIQKGY
jgi:hypothetical protein